MNDVLARPLFAIGRFVLSGQDEEGDCSLIEHLREAGDVGHSGDRDAVELIPWQGEAFADEVLQLAPGAGAAVANENVFAGSDWRLASCSLRELKPGDVVGGAEASSASFSQPF